MKASVCIFCAALMRKSTLKKRNHKPAAHKTQPQCFPEPPRCLLCLPFSIHPLKAVRRSLGKAGNGGSVASRGSGLLLSRAVLTEWALGTGVGARLAQHRAGDGLGWAALALPWPRQHLRGMFRFNPRGSHGPKARAENRLLLIIDW